VYRFRSQICVVALAAVPFALASASLRTPSVQAQPPRGDAGTAVTLAGVDVYEKYPIEPFKGARVGVITNQTGIDAAGHRTIDVLAHRKDVKLVAIFSPEHGIAGREDATVSNSKDEQTGLLVYSLYGATRRPTDEMLRGIDVLVFDVQDTGVRFYTYVTTMAYCMEAAAQHHIRFFVFDRPNPLGGEAIEGPMLDPDRTSFTAYFPMPVRYGMTMGELAQMFNAENKIGADLHVEALLNWRRPTTYAETGLKWIPPSPNLRSPNAAFFYPGLEILQAGGVSVGRGTDKPFEMIGAPWVRTAQLAAELKGRSVPGVTFAPVDFTPNDGVYKGQLCHGVTISNTDPRTLQSMRMGLELADALHRLYPSNFQLDKIIELLGSQSTVERLKRGDAPAEIVAGWAPDVEKFRAMREKYLLYH
jgi:uncharacterized protein YbbC (DUF1343 family)